MNVQFIVTAQSPIGKNLGLTYSFFRPIKNCNWPLRAVLKRNDNLLTQYEQGLKEERNEPPVVIIGNEILGGEAEIRSDLERLVKFYAGEGRRFPTSLFWAKK